MSKPPRYPARPWRFRALNLLVQHAPLARRYEHNSILLCRRLDSSICEHELPPGCDLRVATARDIASMVAHPEGLEARVYAARLAFGDTCRLLSRGEEILAFNWSSRRSAGIMRGFATGIDFMPLEDTQAFTYDFYTYTAHRGQGFGSAMKRAMLAGLYRDGVREVYTLVMPRAIVSVHLHAALGFEPVCMVYGYRLGGWHHTFFGTRRDAARLRQWIERHAGRPGGAP